MRHKVVGVITMLPVLIASFCGLLISLAAFSGHPPEWALDAYYSVFPESAVGGVLPLFLAVGLVSALLFCFSLARILRREKATHVGTGRSDGRSSR